MRRKGIVKSVRGPGGGYLTAQDYQTITVKDIIIAVDEKIDSTQCGGNENCQEGNRCITHNLWMSLNSKILDYLEGLSLEDLINSQNNDDKPITFNSITKNNKDVRVGIV
jgi:Rrf2 family iron-sulfur cluster assembly transcriptional regulator